MQRLSALDASFLAHEERGTHTHIGWVMLFDETAPSYPELREHIESRLHLIPRYRQKLAIPRFEAGRPLWVDDPHFRLDYHLRHTALPKPGSRDQLRNLVGRIFSQRLDRSKPLWETWLVEGLEGGGFAMINKTHHAVVDGISGLDIAAVLFDLSPEPRQVPPPERPWAPGPEPSQLDLVVQGIRDGVRIPWDLAQSALSRARNFTDTLDEAAQAVGGLAGMVSAFVSGAPHTPLNDPIGTHRRFAWARCRLEDFKAIKNALGGTVNDVYLTVVTGALARWLRTRGISTDGLELRACVPVSTRTQDQQGELGNRIAECFAPLPVYCDDPIERFRIVREAMRGIKESKQALGAEAIAALEDFAPPSLLAQASRMNFSPRLYNVTTTNVPGPQVPLYLLGREIKQVGPVGFLAENMALMIVLMSYNGVLEFGLIGDYDAMRDLDDLAAYLEEATRELHKIVS